MNSKKTNRLVAILNIISIVAFYIFAFSTEYIISSMMSGENGGRSVYNSFIIDTLLNNIQIILPIMHSGIGIINIICAIQNKENKKICFWQLVFGMYYLFAGLSRGVALADINADIVDWVNRIIFSVIPIILAIINFIRIRKNRPKVIQVISYIAVIILSILSFLDIIGTYWQIISVIMQLIYIHLQDKNIEESKSRKNINILMYYILQLMLAVGFLGIVIASLIITKVNDDKWKNELEKVYNNISIMQGVTNKEIYIPVEKNYKYGFINEKGQEKIPCKYDRVSYFNEVKINNRTYYIALAKKDTQFYILSKSNDVLVIDDALEKYLQTMYEHFWEMITESMNQDGNYRLGYLQAFEFLFQAFNGKEEIGLTQQTVEVNKKEIFLTEQNSKYYCNNQNYSMLIEHVYDESEEEEYYYNNYRDDRYNYNEDEDMYYISSYEPKYKVTVSKSNGEIQSSIVHLPGINENESTLETFTNGYIEFKNEDGTRNGWYDYNGNQVSIPSNHTIKDIKDDKVMLQVDNDYDDDNYNENTKFEFNFIITDMTGKTLLQTTALDIYNNMYLVKNNNKKMVLLDKDLNVISDEYDKIIATIQMDISANYSSYY